MAVEVKSESLIFSIGEFEDSPESYVSLRNKSTDFMLMDLNSIEKNIIFQNIPEFLFLLSPLLNFFQLICKI